MSRKRTRDLAWLALAGALAAWALAAGRGEAEQPAPGRYAVAAGTNFGLVVDQATGSVWRCNTIDPKCDRLRLDPQ